MSFTQVRSNPEHPKFLFLHAIVPIRKQGVIIIHSMFPPLPNVRTSREPVVPVSTLPQPMYQFLHANGSNLYTANVLVAIQPMTQSRFTQTILQCLYSL